MRIQLCFQLYTAMRDVPNVVFIPLLYIVPFLYL